jgi:hypothetical protein
MIHAEEIRKIVCLQRTVIYEKKTTRYDVGNPDLGLGHEQKCFVDIGGIDGHYCSNFLFIIPTQFDMTKV